MAPVVRVEVLPMRYFYSITDQMVQFRIVNLTRVRQELAVRVVQVAQVAQVAQAEQVDRVDHVLLIVTVHKVVTVAVEEMVVMEAMALPGKV